MSCGLSSARARVRKYDTNERTHVDVGRQQALVSVCARTGGDASGKRIAAWCRRPSVSTLGSLVRTSPSAPPSDVTLLVGLVRLPVPPLAPCVPGMRVSVRRRTRPPRPSCGLRAPSHGGATHGATDHLTFYTYRLFSCFLSALLCQRAPCLWRDMPEPDRGSRLALVHEQQRTHLHLQNALQVEAVQPLILADEPSPKRRFVLQRLALGAATKLDEHLVLR